VPDGHPFPRKIRIGTDYKTSEPEYVHNLTFVALIGRITAGMLQKLKPNMQIGQAKSSIITQTYT